MSSKGASLPPPKLSCDCALPSTDPGSGILGHRNPAVLVVTELSLLMGLILNLVFVLMQFLVNIKTFAS